jgi:hypothetical protein
MKTPSHVREPKVAEALRGHATGRLPDRTAGRWLYAPTGRRARRGRRARARPGSGRSPPTGRDQSSQRHGTPRDARLAGGWRRLRERATSQRTRPLQTGDESAGRQCWSSTNPGRLPRSRSSTRGGLTREPIARPRTLDPRPAAVVSSATNETPAIRGTEQRLPLRRCSSDADRRDPVIGARRNGSRRCHSDVRLPAPYAGQRRARNACAEEHTIATRLRSAPAPETKMPDARTSPRRRISWSGRSGDPRGRQMSHVAR